MRACRAGFSHRGSCSGFYPGPYSLSNMFARLPALLLCLTCGLAVAQPQPPPPAAGAALPVPAAVPASVPQPIRIGEINSYTTIPQFILPYRQGWQLALEQINAGGGLLGRPVQVISRDDAGRPDEAARQAADLVTREHVDVLAGTFVSNTALAVSQYAARNKRLFLASAPLTDALVWERGNRYTFRLRPSTYMLAAIMVEEALRLPGRSWYMIAPNYEYGQSVVATFKALLKARRPEVEFVGEQWPALGKLEARQAAAIVKAASDARPDVIFNALFGADLVQLVRAGKQSGLFPRVPVLSLLTGEPEYLDVLKDDIVPGWIVTGYPAAQIDTPAHNGFAAAYLQKFSEQPKYASVLGYTTLMALAEAVRKAGSTRTEELVTAMRGLRFASPLGPVTLRSQDHQATLGVYVGRIEQRADGARPRGALTGARYVDGAAVQPTDAWVRARRPESANK